MNEKNTIYSPFDLTDKLLGPYMFSKTNRASLSQKMEFYFQDLSMMPLFVQVRTIFLILRSFSSTRG